MRPQGTRVIGRALLRRQRAAAVALCASLGVWTAQPVVALDIPNGDYSKNDPNFVRVMTFNVQQHLGDPGEPTTPWTPSQVGSPLSAINLIVEALDPDVLLLQEIGDIGSGWSFSTVLSNLQAWRNANRPGFSLYLSSDGGSIHNAILSRWPFADLNGDGSSTHADIPTLSAGPGGDWPPGGDGGIRGWTQVEIDLPDDPYPGDLYVGNSHFKAGSGFDSQRIPAAKNIAAYIQYALNLGTDPLNVIPNGSQPPNELHIATPVIWGGDFNSVGSAVPVNVLRSHNPATFDDGTDREGGDSWRSDAATAFDGSTWTHESHSRLDWLYAQDAIAPVDAAFVFDTTRMPANGALQITQGAPPNMQGLLQNWRISTIASDHRPVVADIAVPAELILLDLTILGPNTILSGGFGQFQGIAHFSDGSQQVVTTLGTWSVVGPASINANALLTADIVAFDASAELGFEYSAGSVTLSAEKTLTIASNCLRGDVNGDGAKNGIDVVDFVAVIIGEIDAPQTVCRANMDNNGVIDAVDLALFVQDLLDP